MRRPSKTIQGQSQCVDGVGGVTARQARLVIELGVGVRGQTKTERGNLDACQFNFALFICSPEKQQKKIAISKLQWISHLRWMYLCTTAGAVAENMRGHPGVNKFLDQIFRKISSENRPRIKKKL